MRHALSCAVLLVSLVGAARADEVCRPEGRISVDLDAWAQALRRVKTPAALDQALAKIGLPTSSDGEDASVFSCEGRALLRLHVDVFKAKLREDGETRVVQVLAALCPEAESSWQLQRGAVFVAGGKDTWCRVETPFLNRSGSGWGPQLCNPARFGFEKLTSDTHVVLKLTDEQEWCGSAGIARGGETKVTWWELQGLGLVPLLTVTADRAYYRSPTPPIESLSTKIKVTGVGYPKRVELVEKTTCDDPGEDVRKEDDIANEQLAQCKARTVRKSCVYRDGSYTCAGRK